MSVVTNQVTVGSSAILVVPAPSVPPGAESAVVLSNGAAVVYVGGPGVTTGTGLPIQINGIINIGALGNSPLWAVCATSTVLSYLTTT
jgi:hypothetical protein